MAGAVSGWNVKPHFWFKSWASPILPKLEQLRPIQTDHPALDYAGNTPRRGWLHTWNQWASQTTAASPKKNQIGDVGAGSFQAAPPPPGMVGWWREQREEVWLKHCPWLTFQGGMRLGNGKRWWGFKFQLEFLSRKLKKPKLCAFPTRVKQGIFLSSWNDIPWSKEDSRAQKIWWFLG